MKSGAFANRDFRRYFVGQACSTFGDSAMFLALAIWAKQLTGSSSAAGAVFFAFTAPMMISAPFLGYLADRVHRRPLLIVTNLLSAAVLLPLLMVHGSSQLWIIYVVAVLMGFSTSLLGAGNAGILKDMVADEHLGGANAALRTARDGLRLVSPLVGAGLFAAFGGGAVALVDGATFVVAAIAAVMLRVQESAPEPHDEPLRSSLTAGMRHIRMSPALFRLVTIAATACLVIGFDETLVIAVVDKGLHQAPAFLGVLASIGGAGAILGGVTSVRAIRRLGEM
ncbi:MAG TPA: MFS transporter, partial [Acidimicrobiales bacterium]